MLSSSHVTTDCSISFLGFFCPASDVTGDNIDPFDGEATLSGGLASRLVSFDSLFSSLETSSVCLSTRFFRKLVNMAV